MVLIRAPSPNGTGFPPFPSLNLLSPCIPFSTYQSRRTCPTNFYLFFSFSIECLDHASRRPFYYCAPNDVWSLGVVLVNLTCGRNPWKQASFEDSTYRAFTRNPGFLKTILPLSDELNDILGRIFTRDPEQRISLPELKARIMACSSFTEQPAPSVLPTPPVWQETAPQYVDCEESIMDDDYDYDSPLSPASSDSMSDDGSTCSSEDGSLPSSVEDSDDDDFIEDLPEAKTPPPTLPNYPGPAIREHDEARIASIPEYVPQFSTPSPGPMVPMMVPVPAPCPSKFQLLPLWDVFKYAQSGPQLHHPMPFHHQVPLFATF